MWCQGPHSWLGPLSGRCPQLSFLLLSFILVSSLALALPISILPVALCNYRRLGCSSFVSVWIFLHGFVFALCRDSFTGDGRWSIDLVQFGDGTTSTSVCPTETMFIWKWTQTDSPAGQQDPWAYHWPYDLFWYVADSARILWGKVEDTHYIPYFLRLLHSTNQILSQYRKPASMVNNLMVIREIKQCEF